MYNQCPALNGSCNELACLNCPLPRCVYDEPNGFETLRDRAIVEQFQEGQKVPELTLSFGLRSKRIRSILQKGVSNENNKTTGGTDILSSWGR